MLCHSQTGQNYRAKVVNAWLSAPSFPKLSQEPSRRALRAATRSRKHELDGGAFLRLPRGHRKCSHADPEAAVYGDRARSRGRVLGAGLESPKPSAVSRCGSG
jgi:hypothetical protein